jgi:hypothetical protein
MKPHQPPKLKPLSLRCPCCRKSFSSPSIKRKVHLVKHDGATLGCPNVGCGKLLILKDGKLLDFHKYLNKKDRRWPKDGKGTGSVAI